MRTKIYILIGFSQETEAEDFNVSVFTSEEEAYKEKKALEKLHGNSEFYNAYVVLRTVDVEEHGEFYEKLGEAHRELEQEYEKKIDELKQKEYYLKKLLKELL